MIFALGVVAGFVGTLVGTKNGWVAGVLAWVAIITWGLILLDTIGAI